MVPERVVRRRRDHVAERVARLPRVQLRLGAAIVRAGDLVVDLAEDVVLLRERAALLGPCGPAARALRLELTDEPLARVVLERALDTAPEIDASRDGILGEHVAEFVVVPHRG